MIYQICITQECNFACVYCFEKQKNYKEHLTIEKIRENCDFIIRDSYTKQEKIIVNISGGEPLIRFDLVKYVIEYLVDKIKDIHFEISTNAMLLSDKIVTYLNKNNISLYIGFDGIAKSQNLNRKTVLLEDSFSIVYTNIKKLFERQDLHFESIILNMVISYNNVKNMYKNYNFLLKISNYNNVSINPVYEEIWNKKYLKLYRKGLRKINKLYLKLILLKNGVFSLQITDKYVHKIISNNKAYPSVELCGAGNTSVSIMTDGTLLPCGDMVYTCKDYEDLIIGSVKTGIDTNYLTKFRNNIKFDLECCNQCDFLYKCIFCPALNKRVTNDINIIPYQVCELNKIHILESEYFISKFYKKSRDIFKVKYGLD